MGIPTIRSIIRILSFGLWLPGLAMAWQTVPQPVDIPHPQGNHIRAFLFSQDADEGVARPAVVMMHGCAGAYSWSNPDKGVASLYREWGDRLVEAGYHALLLDSFSFRGAPQNQCGMGNTGTSEVHDRPFDVMAAWQYLDSRDWVEHGRLALLGWSHGASSVMASLHEGHLPMPADAFRVSAAFYPGCGFYNAFGGITYSVWTPVSPLLILHAGRDSLYQSGFCDTRIANAEALGATFENGRPISMLVYEGAQHSFDMARASSSKWKLADHSAKLAADAEILAMFSTWLNCTGEQECTYLPRP